MEVKLTDNSRLRLDWTRGGSLSVQLFRPGNLRDGHGYLLSATAILDGEALNAFLDAMDRNTRPPEVQKFEVSTWDEKRN